jgi:D-alanyl-lipoteichoic acid acyltransferase DltB (MBOAT superfamily)
MLFNTVRFFVFLAAVLALFYAAPRPARKPVLLVASYYFYMCWNPVFALLLLTLTAIDYAAALWIVRAETRRRKRLLLLVSLGANLGFLGFFKYYNFAAANLAILLDRPMNAFALDIILPLGISFHTFQSISYVVDVYRGEQAAIRNPLDYALYIAFFPQLVAGPIVRARAFFADLYAWKRPDSAQVSHGVLLVLLGLTKKTALADQFAQISDEYFKNIAAHPGMLSAWSGAFAFGMQIYFDFSGYTDMAIGMAELLGFHFPVNFRRPYLAASVTDFWQRWHISLSTWLRDYIYFPLGANRHGAWAGYRNLMITMLLGGLWHGANWNFLIWGGYHGLWLSVERATGLARMQSKALHPVRALATFAAVLVGWVFFRAATLADSTRVLDQMFGGGVGTWIVPPWLMALAGICFVAAVLEEKRKWFERVAAGPVWAYASVCALLLLSVELIGVTEKAVPFVYFQF